MDIIDIRMPNFNSKDHEDSNTDIAGFADTKKIVFDSMTSIVEQLEDIESKNHDIYMENVNLALQMTNNILQSLTARISSSWFETTGNLLESVFHSLDNLLFIDFARILADRQELDKQTAEVINRVLVESKWIPTDQIVLDSSDISSILDILDSTKDGSKSREKKIDAIIFKTITKKRITEMKRKWKEADLPFYVLRIMRHAVQAYENKQYALTLSSLVILWEKIVYLKHGSNIKRTDEQTKWFTQDLLSQNNIDEHIKMFFNQYVYRGCNRESDVIDNIPSRHITVHGWLPDYPSKKVALNAILVTDFLVRLEPIKNMDGEDNG